MISDYPRHCLIVLLLLGLGGCHTFRSTAINEQMSIARNLTFHGLNALHNGRDKQAQQLLNRAAQNCPDDQRIRRHLATALLNQGQIDQAIAELEIAVKHCANDPKLHVELGQLFLMKKQPHIALEHADAALQQNRQLASAWLLKGRGLRELGHFRDALSCFHRAANYPGAVPETHLELAKSYRQLGQPMLALTSLELHNEQFAPDQISTEVLLLTGQALIDLNQFPRAIGTLAVAAQREDSQPETWIALSRAQLEAGDISNARLTASTAERRFQGNVQIQQWAEKLANPGSEPLQASREF